MSRQPGTPLALLKDCFKDCFENNSPSLDLPGGVVGIFWLFSVASLLMQLAQKMKGSGSGEHAAAA